MSSGNPLTPTDILKSRSPASPAPQKGVEILAEPDEIIPPPVYNNDDERPSSSRQHRASIIGKKMTGRPALHQSDSSTSLARQVSNLNVGSTENVDSSSLDGSQNDAKWVLNQVADWLQQEKAKRSKKTRKKKKPSHAEKEIAPDEDDDEDESEQPGKELMGDDTELDLGSLEGILAGYMKSSTGTTPRILSRKPSLFSRKGSIAKKFKRNSVAPQSSDTEFFGDEVMVPNVEANLDNSKTLAYTGGSDDEDTSDQGNDKAKKKDVKHWKTFKKDILRLTHTLRLKGWRRIPMEQGGELEVSRLSGALTNAVYVVKPPKHMHDENSEGNPPKQRPMQLLLRIYGPQVEHLIDRDSELNILKRLARKKIGPRMLGTFSNGRFEEYLYAKTLEAKDLRVPETSKQIAKRMRELHDGIELLDEEVDAGPAIFLNWDKWVDRCEKVISWLDQQVQQAESGNEPNIKAKYTRLGLICGFDWFYFRQTYDTYRAKLLTEYGGEAGIRKKLVFAHNDTQYGNLMRLVPSGESPLIKPANQHKQLVVIDFEYAGQNTAGLEFANHFTEWCYNYHDAEKPYACNDRQYPTPEEQYRFVRSYVMHRPQFNAAASATPKMEGREKTNVSDFILDARAPQGSPGDYNAEEKAREKKMEEDIQKLIHETRLWRIANTAQWVAWGIVQAKVPELDEPPKKSKRSAMMDKVKSKLHTHSETQSEDEKGHKDAAKGDEQEEAAHEDGHTEGEEADDEEFDYLAYAQERAMFFWGDCLQMGLIKEEELPEGMKKMIKVVPY